MGSCGANRREFKDQSAIKGNLGQKNVILVAKQGLMGIRPNKTNFGLSFGHFKEQNMKERKEEKKKKKKKRKGMETMFCMETRILYGSVCMEISGSISRV